MWLLVAAAFRILDAAAQQNDNVDLVQLVPFDVQIAVTVDWGIEWFEVSNIVTDWMNGAYRMQLQAFGYTEENLYAEFDSVVLFNNDDDDDARKLQAGGGELFTAKFRGGAVFSRTDVRPKSVPVNDVLLIQQVALLNDTSLTAMLQESSVLGLGPAVVDVNAFLNPSTTDEDSSSTPTTTPAPTFSQAPVTGSVTDAPATLSPPADMTVAPIALPTAGPTSSQAPMAGPVTDAPTLAAAAVAAANTTLAPSVAPISSPTTTDRCIGGDGTARGCEFSDEATTTSGSSQGKKTTTIWISIAAMVLYYI